MSISCEGFDRGICGGVCVSMFASWCNLREEVLAGDLDGPPCNCKGEVQNTVEVDECTLIPNLHDSILEVNIQLPHALKLVHMSLISF